MSTIYKVTGMTCGGCANAVTNAVKRMAPGATVKVDLAKAQVAVDGAANDAAIAQAIKDAGFGFGGRA